MGSGERHGERGGVLGRWGKQQTHYLKKKHLFGVKGDEERQPGGKKGRKLLLRNESDHRQQSDDDATRADAARNRTAKA